MNVDFIKIRDHFKEYLINDVKIAPGTANSYIARLKFLLKDNEYEINENITKEIINFISSREEKKRETRDSYQTAKAARELVLALDNYFSFVQSNSNKNFEIRNHEIKEIENLGILSETEKDSIIKSRIGQNVFRDNLVEYWKGCSITEINKNELLIASHIKSWKDSNNFERLDVYNGLLLLPNYDKLFDMGFISFNTEGTIIISNKISETEIKILGIHKNIKLIKVDARHQKYLNYHRENYFKG